MTKERFSILFGAWDTETKERLFPIGPIGDQNSTALTERDTDKIRRILDYIEFQMARMEQKGAKP